MQENNLNHNFYFFFWSLCLKTARKGCAVVHNKHLTKRRKRSILASKVLDYVRRSENIRRLSLKSVWSPTASPADGRKQHGRSAGNSGAIACKYHERSCNKCAALPVGVRGRGRA